MNDDIATVGAAENEPRIAFIRSSAFGFHGNAGLDQRRLDAVEFGNAGSRPIANRRFGGPVADRLGA